MKVFGLQGESMRSAPVADKVGDDPKGIWSPPAAGAVRAAAFEERTDRDADFDALADGEVLAPGSVPLRRDSAGDGLFDGTEVRLLGTEPLAADGDGALDGEERYAGSDPLDPASTPGG